MRARRTFSVRFKRVPARKTAAVKILGRVGIGAEPAACGVRRPAADWTANFFKIGFVGIYLEIFENFFGFIGFAKGVEN